MIFQEVHTYYGTQLSAPCESFEEKNPKKSINKEGHLKQDSFTFSVLLFIPFLWHQMRTAAFL